MRFDPALVLACTTFALSPVANAAQWYVAPGGHGDGTSPASAFDTVQKGLDAAQPGDAVIVAAGTYDESIQTVRDGTDSAAITLTAETGANVVITSSGRVLRVDHAYFSVSEVVLDGQYGESDVLDINDGATGFVLSRSEVRHSGRDCVDVGAPSDVLIDRCQIHHCLDSREGRTDAHGVTGGAVRNLTLRDTTIHTFSGDGIQFDPGRELPGWDGLVIEGCEIRLEPLSQSENGFAQGTVPGENAVDTKTNDDAPRANLTITDTIARGFRGGLISNMAAFNLKENINVLVDRVTVSDSEIAFRLRGPGSHPGAWVRLQNAVVYDVDVAVRYEDDIENLRVYNATFGRDIGLPFVNASSDASVLDVRNLLLLGDAMPAEGAGSTSNMLATDAFFPAAGYTLADNAAAIDAGEAIDGVTHDRAGTERPQGGAVDVGAYEWCEGGCAGNTGGNAGASTGGSGGSATGGSGGAAGENATGGTSGDAGAGGSGQGASAGSAGAPPPSAGDTSDDGGCGCRAARTPINPWWGLTVAGLWLAWRRRRTSIAKC
jgi:MYXO-CTERM domain-containing protein